MSVSVEMQRSVKKLAGPRMPEDNRETMIARAARRAGLSYRQAKSFFYKESENPGSMAVELVRAAIANGNHIIEEATADEIKSLRARLSRLESIVSALSPHRDGAGAGQDGDLPVRLSALDRQENRSVD